MLDSLAASSFSFDSQDASTCMMSEWITWSPCSVSCGAGTRSRERYVKQFPDDGSICTLPTEETENCVVNEECCEFLISFSVYQTFISTHYFSTVSNTEFSVLCTFLLVLAPSSCLVTEWGEWDVCSATCGLGMKRRERMVKMPPADGSICGAEVLEVEKCMMPECRE